ncbi:vascular endothelial growth factor receptor kdr-like [Ruditapes philippinarum]|uniref:vascular endothelial growth factor receptor kdr-like n=1 Tax=Ruditapes philippinarum TaxID=129788 RepID=UPI00295B3824|nr:vascular endothelial growth factor receptor kdr-like [Ruditapes philippinarum]
MTTLLVPVLFLATIEITGSQELPGSQLHNLLNTHKPVIEFSNSSINASSGEVVLNAGTYGYERAFRQGDSLNVTCYSSLPTLWFVVQGGERSGPDFSQQDVLGEINVTHQTYFGRHGHSSNLYIENIKYDYTGLYVCTLAQDSKVNSSIYIFAKDLERPFTDHNYVDIPNYPNDLVLYLKTEFTIPCQTSFPDINVTFRCLCADPKPLGPEQGVVFDPKRGVRIETVDKSFDGVFACETNVNGITYSRTFTLLLIDSVFPFTLKPALQPSADVHKYIGEDFLISCFVEVLVGIRPVITWFHSNTEVQESNRISITKVHKVDSGLNDFEEFRSDLLVRGVIPSDDGIYKCTAWNSPEDKGEVDINFFVHERAFVTLVAEEENITVTEGQSLKLIFHKISTYTKNPNLTG